MTHGTRDTHEAGGAYDTAAEEEFWDGRYGESERIWSGDPNAALVREVSGMEPGTVLDLGCGEGGDAIWLARQGWRVTAVDISRIALERAARHAASVAGDVAGDVAGRIDWQRHDLATSFPEGTFDLVSAQFLHSPGDMPRERILRAAASAVAPGGVLLIVGHAGPPSWETEPDRYGALPTPREVLESLDLPDGEWEVLVSEEHPRTQTGPDGLPGTRTDNTLKIRRLAG
ncbi:methyltransferase domain-containing protein [Streptosporangium sp. NPDC023615]|uniref:class I SAM-dependent methyltransferase n=1 Tax=Streptosporangium sp. NPDC023615 TaxID=3154794 RepID=UPI00341556CA